MTLNWRESRSDGVGHPALAGRRTMPRPVLVAVPVPVPEPDPFPVPVPDHVLCFGGPCVLCDVCCLVVTFGVTLLVFRDVCCLVLTFTVTLLVYRWTMCLA
jgi:hypothetical protein